jgi:hypothetical protein
MFLEALTQFDEEPAGQAAEGICIEIETVFCGCRYPRRNTPRKASKFSGNLSLLCPGSRFSMPICESHIRWREALGVLSLFDHTKAPASRTHSKRFAKVDASR